MHRRRDVGATQANKVMPGAIEREGESKHVRELQRYLLSRSSRRRQQREQKEEMRETESKRQRKEEVVRRICASAPDAASSLSSPPSRNLPLSPFFSPIADDQEAAAQSRGRRGALCVSENVALIGGSVAVMRYQPPANKRINIKRWRWIRRRRKVARGTRVKTAIENKREEEEEKQEEKEE